MNMQNKFRIPIGIIFTKKISIEYFSKRMMAKECGDHPWLAKKYTVSSVQQQVEKTISKPQASKHRIPRVQMNSMDELDMTKDNLKLFVERWREHPDSPYLIDLPQCITLPHQYSTPRDHEELVSLRGHSPSPCASISSTLSEMTDNSPQESYGSFLAVPTFNFGFERRASEGVATEKLRSDPASQIVLAEEIIKLSERLRSIAMGACMNEEVESSTAEDKVNNKMEKVEDKDKRNGVSSRNNGLIGENATTECNEITEKLSSIMRHRKLNGTTFHSNRSFEKHTEASSGNMFAPLKKKKQKKEEGRGEEGGKVRRESLEGQVEDLTNDKNERISGRKEGEMDLTPPWRRPRVKQFGETSRDVPRISGLRNLHKSLNLDEPTSTKDLLLHLLGEWEEVSMKPSGGRKSVSVDWCGEESVARKTMNSLAEYFQSKQQKSTTANVNSPTSNSIHR